MPEFAGVIRSAEQLQGLIQVLEAGVSQQQKELTQRIEQLSVTTQQLQVRLSLLCARCEGWLCTGLKHSALYST